MGILKHIKIFSLAVVAICILNSVVAFGYVKVNVKDSNNNSMPILAFNFMYDIKSKWVADIINKNISFDLQNSGSFSIFNQDVPNDLNYNIDLTQSGYLMNEYVSFNAIIVGKVTYKNGIYTVNYVVWDTYRNKAILEKGFNLKELSKEDTLYLAHHISNKIYEAFIGENGYFNSKIAFVNKNALYIMDYNGENKKFIVKSKEDLYTPVFSNDNRYLAYIELNKGVSGIYAYDLQKKVNYKLGNFSNIVLAPRFSSDNRYMLFAISNHGNTNIYKLDLVEKKIQQLTFSNAINIPGSFSPDNKYITFTSDRLGSPQIYIMDNNGSNVRRVSRERGAYFIPKWSQKGDLLAFTKIMKGGHFLIGVMGVNGKRERIIANDRFAEGPSWSEDSRNLIYQFEYEKNKFAFYLVNLSNSYKLMLKPFDSSKNPYLSSNFKNPQITEKEYNLK